MILEFRKRPLGAGVTALEIIGNIHCGPECARLEREVEAMIAAQETRVILDMAQVTHADSAAIGAIVRCFSKVKGAGGTLRIASPQPMIDYSLKLTKIDRVIEVFPTVDLAVKRFSDPSSGASQQV